MPPAGAKGLRAHVRARPRLSLANPNSSPVLPGLPGPGQKPGRCGHLRLAASLVCQMRVLRAGRCSVRPCPPFSDSLCGTVSTNRSAVSSPHSRAVHVPTSGPTARPTASPSLPQTPTAAPITPNPSTTPTAAPTAPAPAPTSQAPAPPTLTPTLDPIAVPTGATQPGSSPAATTGSDSLSGGALSGIVIQCVGGHHAAQDPRSGSCGAAGMAAAARPRACRPPTLCESNGDPG